MESNKIREELLKSGIISAPAAGEEDGENNTPDSVNAEECIEYEGKTNIILIGMPGCGKSTIGRKLAKDYGFVFSDADSEFAQKYGMSAAECINSCGEAEFRRRESEVLKEYMPDKRMCIATGGGVVTVPGNLEILKKLGFIVYLKRDLDKLSVKGRPLSTGKGVEQLYRERSVFYESWCDGSVMNKTIPETVSRIMQMYSEKI